MQSVDRRLRAGGHPCRGSTHPGLEAEAAGTQARRGRQGRRRRGSAPISCWSGRLLVAGEARRTAETETISVGVVLMHHNAGDGGDAPAGGESDPGQRRGAWIRAASASARSGWVTTTSRGEVGRSKEDLRRSPRHRCCRPVSTATRSKHRRRQGTVRGRAPIGRGASAPAEGICRLLPGDIAVVRRRLRRRPRPAPRGPRQMPTVPPRIWREMLRGALRRIGSDPFPQGPFGAELWRCEAVGRLMQRLRAVSSHPRGVEHKLHREGSRRSVPNDTADERDHDPAGRSDTTFEPRPIRRGTEHGSTGQTPMAIRASVQVATSVTPGRRLPRS